MNTLLSFLEPVLQENSFELLLSSNRRPRVRVGRNWKNLEAQEIKSSSLRSMLFEVLDSEQRDFLLKEKVYSGQIFTQGKWVRFQASLHLSGIDVSFSWTPQTYAAFLPQNAFVSFLKASSLHFLSSPQKSARAAVLEKALNEIFKERNLRTLSFLGEELSLQASESSFSVYEKKDFKRWSANPETADLIVCEPISSEDVDLALDLAGKGFSVLCMRSCTESVPMLESVVNESQNPSRTRWRLAQVFQSAMSCHLVPGLEEPWAMASDFVLATDPGRQHLLQEKWSDLKEHMQSSGERTQMRSFNQSLVQLLTKRKVDLKVAFEHSPDPENLDHLLKKVGL